MNDDVKADRRRAKCGCIRNFVALVIDIGTNTYSHLSMLFSWIVFDIFLRSPMFPRSITRLSLLVQRWLVTGITSGRSIALLMGIGEVLTMEYVRSITPYLLCGLVNA